MRKAVVSAVCSLLTNNCVAVTLPTETLVTYGDEHLTSRNEDALSESSCDRAALVVLASRGQDTSLPSLPNIIKQICDPCQSVPSEAHACIRRSFFTRFFPWGVPRLPCRADAFSDPVKLKSRFLNDSGDEALWAEGEPMAVVEMIIPMKLACEMFVPSAPGLDVDRCVVDGEEYVKAYIMATYRSHNRWLQEEEEVSYDCPGCAFCQSAGGPKQRKAKHMKARKPRPAGPQPHALEIAGIWTVLAPPRARSHARIGCSTDNVPTVTCTQSSEARE